jgi:hypothetical protein
MLLKSIPIPVINVVSEVLAAHYYSHRRLETLFSEAGAPGDPPDGNCFYKCTGYLRRCNEDPAVDAFAVLGAVLADLMETAPDGLTEVTTHRDRVTKVLTKFGLRYEQGGHIRGALSATPSRTFEELLRRHDFSTVDAEFKRAMDNIDTDPAAALTAACATLESICLVFIEDVGLPMPAKKTLGELWPAVKTSLNFDPRAVADDDLKRILGGIASIVDGVAAFRTHAGSAHGRGRGGYKPRPRHARLGVHAAHTLAAFVIETWDERKAAPKAS